LQVLQSGRAKQRKIYLKHYIYGIKWGVEMIAEKIIRFLGMKPLADEGGYYVETCRSRARELF
jgi:hypothetical protein